MNFQFLISDQFSMIFFLFFHVIKLFSFFTQTHKLFLSFFYSTCSYHTSGNLVFSISPYQVNFCLVVGTGWRLSIFFRFFFSSLTGSLLFFTASSQYFASLSEFCLIQKTLPDRHLVCYGKIKGLDQIQDDPNPDVTFNYKRPISKVMEVNGGFYRIFVIVILMTRKGIEQRNENCELWFQSRWQRCIQKVTRTVLFNAVLTPAWILMFLVFYYRRMVFHT